MLYVEYCVVFKPVRNTQKTLTLRVPNTARLNKNDTTGTMTNSVRWKFNWSARNPVCDNSKIDAIYYPVLSLLFVRLTLLYYVFGSDFYIEIVVLYSLFLTIRFVDNIKHFKHVFGLFYESYEKHVALLFEQSFMFLINCWLRKRVTYCSVTLFSLILVRKKLQECSELLRVIFEGNGKDEMHVVCLVYNGFLYF